MKAVALRWPGLWNFLFHSRARVARLGGPNLATLSRALSISVSSTIVGGFLFYSRALSISVSAAIVGGFSFILGHLALALALL